MKYLSILLLALTVTFIGCNNRPPTERIAPTTGTNHLKDTSFPCENRYFPTNEQPVTGKLVVFFNAKSCPSCIIDINSYVNVLKRTSRIDALFCTNIGNTNLGGLDKVITSLQTMKVSPVFSNLEYPVIFETDQEGRVRNTLPIDPAYLQVSFDYLKKYASNQLNTR